jgi:hypothetical protein
MTTLGHAHIVTYAEFTGRLVHRFDRRDPELSFRDLAQLKQTGTTDAYISDFQRISVMVTDISEARLVMLFTEGLAEPLRGWVKAYKPTTLQDAVGRARDLQESVPKTKFTPRPDFPTKLDDRTPPQRDGTGHQQRDWAGQPQRDWTGRNRMDDATRQDLRRRKLCFSCQEPWVPGHRCAGKAKAHYIEVFSDSGDDEEEEEQGQKEDSPTAEVEQASMETRGVIASLSGIPRFHTFRMRGGVQGHRVTVLVDGGASHNFIDSSLVERKSIAAESFGGFSVVIPGENTLDCTRYVPRMTLNLGNYMLTDDFYVVKIPDTNVVLGVQWLYSLGRYSTNYQTMEMEFQDQDGKRVVLRGMNTYPPKVVTAKKMEAVMRQDDIARVAEFHISVQRSKGGEPNCPRGIHDLFRVFREHIVFGDVHPGRPPDREFEDISELEEGTRAVLTTSYRHPRA